MPEKWEYKMITQETKGLLKKGAAADSVSGELTERIMGLGREGWELVSVSPVSTVRPFDMGGSTRALVLFFKRKV